MPGLTLSVKKPPVPPKSVVLALQIGRPREVEKGSRRTVAGLLLMPGLYKAAARVNLDSRFSMWTSSTPFLRRIDRQWAAISTTELGRERARDDSYKDDGASGRLADYADAKWVHTGALNPVLLDNDPWQDQQSAPRLR